MSSSTESILLSVSTDVTDTSQVAALMERALDEYGKVDILLNNAGIVRGKGAEAIWDISDEDWRIGIDFRFQRHHDSHSKGVS